MEESRERAVKQEVSHSEIGSFNWFSNLSFASSGVGRLSASAFFFLGSHCGLQMFQSPLPNQFAHHSFLKSWTIVQDPFEQSGTPELIKACLHLRDVERKVTKKQTCSRHKPEIVCKLEERFMAELPPLRHPSKLIPLQENKRSCSIRCNVKKKNICSAKRTR